MHKVIYISCFAYTFYNIYNKKMHYKLVGHGERVWIYITPEKKAIICTASLESGPQGRYVPPGGEHGSQPKTKRLFKQV